MAGLTGGRTGAAGEALPFMVAAQAPRRSGRLRLVSAGPESLPHVDLGYLAGPEDRARMRAAVTAAATVLTTSPMTALGRPGPTFPGTEVLGHAVELDRWIAENLGTAQHTCGTVPMGPADEPEHAAVDQYGRVHGIAALRVADTSILPDAPLRGPANTAVLIGEIIADAMCRALP